MAHQIVTEIRKILPADLPKVREVGGVERTANTQDLLNLGIVPTDEPDHYVCRVQERNDLDDSRQYKPIRPLPGIVLARGHSRREVYGKLPAHVRVKLVRARVRRTVGGKEIELTIPVQAVRPADVVEAEGLPPVAFAGEPER